MTTPSAIVEIVKWLADHQRHFAYSENGGRLDPDSSGYTDCSGLSRYLYLKYADLNIGTYTGNECTHGTLVTTSRTNARAGKGMLPGDLVFYRWSNRAIGSDPYDHVNIYVGGDKVQNHGGPGRGPVAQSLQSNVDNAVAVMVRRYIQPVPEDDMAVADQTAINKHTDTAIAKVNTEVAEVKSELDGIKTMVAKVLSLFESPDGEARHIQTLLDAELNKKPITQASADYTAASKS